MDGIKTTAFLAAALCWGLTQAQVGNNDSVLNPNIADEGELAGVAHLDEGLVAGIVDGRPFASTLEVDALLSGSLSDEQRAEVYAELFIPLNLNTAFRRRKHADSGNEQPHAAPSSRIPALYVAEQFARRSASTWMRRKLRVSSNMYSCR